MTLAIGPRLLGAVALCALAFVIVMVWRIGPVVMTATSDHGLHVGDLLALPVLAAAAQQLRPALRVF